MRPRRARQRDQVQPADNRLAHAPRGAGDLDLPRRHARVAQQLQDQWADSQAAHTAAPDIFDDGVDGFIVPIRSSAAIAEKLQLLEGDRARLREMKLAARQKAQVHRWEHYRTCPCSTGTGSGFLGIDAMNGVVRPKATTSAVPMPPDVGAEKALRYTRRLIWTYLLLLIFEGALRKWIVPRFSDPLLVVRDPIVIAIYVCALRARVFPRNIFVTSLGIIAGLSWLISIVVLLPYLPHKIILFVTAYGFRSQLFASPAHFCDRQCVQRR